MNYILAHDVGTSGSKGTLFNDRLEMITSESAHYEVVFPEKGYAEQDPLDWWGAIIRTTHSILENTEIKAENIRGMVFSAQMAGVLPVDINGDALMNCLTWLDTRAAPQAEKIIGKGFLKISGYSLFPLIQFLRITGGSPGIAGKDAISKIMWLKEEAPTVYRESVKLLDVKDYLIYRCTGEYVTSRDCAHITWLMDSRPGKFNWSEALLKKYAIDGSKLPQIKKSTDLAGSLSPKAAQELGLPKGVPVIVGAGDMASAAIGSGAVEAGETHVYVGTSSWIGAHLPSRKKDLSHYMGSICSAHPAMYLCIAEQETASGCLEWIKSNVVREFSYDQLNEYVSTVEPGSGGVIFTPWLFGERSPLDDPDVRGGFYNLSLEHDRGHMARAVFEGVAVNIKWGLMYFEKLVAGTAPLDRIHLIGGGAKSDVWCQIFADAFARPVLRMENPLGAGARGAAAIALVGLKKFDTFSDIKSLIKVETHFDPVRENTRVYENILKEFQEIYKKKVSTNKK
ncbi:MAG: FGGY-family carbohydrate kinase [Theionarchaea archaeon]|nr:FGGY-family carbohydrate kinase [Theionarchaea archaeon]